MPTFKYRVCAGNLMRFSVLKQFERHLARGAALGLMAGLAAGCSSNVARFQDSLFTGSATPSNREVASQPYPGDNLDNTYTGSVQQKRPRPEVPVGRANRQAPANTGTRQWSAPRASTSNMERAPLPAPDGSRRSQRGPQDRPALAPVASERAQSRAAPRELLPSGTAPEARKPARTERPGGTRLTVRRGETLYSLSRRFDVPLEAILAANNMASANELQAGQELVIPSYAYSTSAAASAFDNKQKVASLRPEPAPDERRRDKETPGQPASGHRAVLPQSPKTREDEAGERDNENTAPDTAGNESVHTVVAGDTLYGISRKTGVSVARLKEANGLSGGYLHVGQKLKIPSGDGREVAAERQGSDPETTGSTTASAKAETDERKARKVSTYTPPKDDTVAEESGTEQVASVPDTTGVGRLRWPVGGRVISKFGDGGGGPADDGIDIAVPDGTPVKAAENGVVIYAGDGLKEFGNTVLVRHEDGLVTVYGYASKLLVKRGDTVRRGQEVALSGMSGNADRPKVHFEVRKESAPVDPMKYLK